MHQENSVANKFRHISDLFAVANAGLRRTYTVLDDIDRIRTRKTTSLYIVSTDFDKFRLKFPVKQTKCSVVYNVNCVDGDLVTNYTVNMRAAGSGPVSLNFDSDMIARSFIDPETKIYTPDNELLALYILANRFTSIQCEEWEFKVLKQFMNSRVLFR